MAHPLLSVVLIAKNEEASIGRLLDSLVALEPVGYEVCLYDTGSTDRTVEIARAAGARVERGEWVGDYGAARNKALAMARGTWALSLDADEAVSVDALALGRELRAREMERPRHFAAEVEIAGVRDDTEQSVWRARRLLRVGEVTWYRPIHEIAAPFRDSNTVLGPPVPSNLLRILNFGFDDLDRFSASLQRKHAILEQLRDDQVARGVQGDDLAQTHLDLARSHKGFLRIDDAIEEFKKALSVPENTQTRPWILQYLTETLIEQDRFLDAGEYLDELRVYPELASFTAWQEARILARTGHPESARVMLVGLSEVRDYQNILVPRSTIYRWLVWSARQSGRRDDAIAAALTLVAIEADAAGVDPLISLWGSRPPATLASLLTRALGPGRTATEIAALLRTDPRGAAIAAVLDPAGADSAVPGRAPVHA